MIGKIWGMNPRILIFLFLLILCLIPPTSSNPTVTIVAAGDQHYYGGEDIQLSGTNTLTDKTYLFLCGPNLPSNGGSIKVTDPKNVANKVVTDVETNFQVINVQSDKTWSWTWKTKNVSFEAGTYTIYAVSAPKDKTNLANATYGTTSILIFPENSLIWTNTSSSSIKKGEELIITGCAQGHPSNGVQIWIFGKNYTLKENVKVDNMETFSYDISQEATKKLDAGTYYVVVQHPMGNGIFNIDRCLTNSNDVCNIQTGGQTKIFTMLGPGSIVGADAAEALVTGIKEPNVDDTSLEIQFSVVEPATTTTSVPTTVSTTAITTTIVPTTSQTTAVTTSSTTTPITTLVTTVTTPPSPTLTTAPTDSVNKLLEEQNKKIEEQNKKLADLNKTIAEQNQKLSEQNDILTQIINFLKSMFGWK